MKQREKMVVTFLTAQADAASAHAEADKLRLRGDRKSLQARDEAENVRFVFFLVLFVLCSDHCMSVSVSVGQQS